MQKSVPNPTTEALVSYGLDEPLDNNQKIFGKLNMTSVEFPSEDHDSVETFGYQYDITEKYSNAISSSPISFVGGNTENGQLVLAEIAGDDEDKSWQPHIYNAAEESMIMLPNVGGLNVTDLSVSPDGKKYAYAYQTKESQMPEESVIGSWKIAIHTFGDDFVETIDNASDPEWLNEGSQIVFLSEEGIKRYDVATRLDGLISEKYTQITSDDDLAVSPDSQSVIFTKPSLNMLSVFKFGNGDSLTGSLEEVGRMVSENIGYSNPLFSPDSKHYLVTSTKFIGSSDTTFRTEDVIKRFEVRQVNSREVQETVNIEEINILNISINSWE
jgi:dipeptidyl aminopeptidase/acylaminoacyl peptidase